VLNLWPVYELTVLVRDPFLLKVKFSVIPVNLLVTHMSSLYRYQLAVSVRHFVVL